MARLGISVSGSILGILLLVLLVVLIIILVPLWVLGILLILLALIWPGLSRQMRLIMLIFGVIFLAVSLVGGFPVLLLILIIVLLVLILAVRK